MFLELQQWEIQKRDLRDCVLQLKRLMQRYSKTDESEESQYHTSHARMTQLMTISQAVDAQQRRYSLKESVGKVSAEFAYLYPPGIPIMCRESR